MDTLGSVDISGKLALEQPVVALKGWTIDRQFRLALGLSLAVFLLGYFLVSEIFIVIPVILCIGLTYTSIIDRCYMRLGIAMLPWNNRAVIK